jgi:hypothetical protein
MLNSCRRLADITIVCAELDFSGATVHVLAQAVMPGPGDLSITVVELELYAGV